MTNGSAPTAIAARAWMSCLFFVCYDYSNQTGDHYDRHVSLFSDSDLITVAQDGVMNAGNSSAVRAYLGNHNNETIRYEQLNTAIKNSTVLSDDLGILRTCYHYSVWWHNVVGGVFGIPWLVIWSQAFGDHGSLVLSTLAMELVDV